MEQAGWILDEEQWKAWAGSLPASGGRVIAPARGPRGEAAFTKTDDADQIARGYPGKTQMSPKEFLFPRSETLFEFRLAGNTVTLVRPPRSDNKQVLIGLRPCDAAGLRRLDEVFLQDPADEAYEHRRNQTVVIVEACTEATPSCFCTAVGGSPGGTEGADLHVTRLGGSGRILLRAITQTGSELASAASASWARATEADFAEAGDQAEAVSSSIRRQPLPARTPELLEGSFEAPEWEVVASACIGCGICTYACPSCSCFDIADTGGAACGSRCRSWDSCAFGEFTKHASGHNPRPKQSARYRQRLMHKFAYFPSQHAGQLMCVGCGRCIDLCPAGIDIHQAVLALAGAARAAHRGADEGVPV